MIFSYFLNLCHAYGLSTHRFRMISVSKSHDFMGLLMFIVYFRWLFPCHKTMVSFYEAKINPVTPRLRTSRQGLQAEVGTKLTILRGEWRGKVRSHESSNDCHVIYWREITNDMILKIVYKIGYTNSIIQFNLIWWTHTHTYLGKTYCYISLTWNKAIWGIISLINHDSRFRSQWGCYSSPNI